MRILYVNLLCLIGLVTLASCQSKIDGGTTHDEAEAVTIEYGDLRYRDTRSYSASTQPSIKGHGALTIDGFSAGIKPIVERFKNSWQLGILFFVTGAAVWYIWRRWLVALCLFSLGVMAVLYPALLVWLAAAGVGLTLWANRNSFKEVVSGNQAAFEVMPVEDVETAKVLMAKRQSAATRSAIKGIK